MTWQIFRNGRIYTADRAGSWVGAVAVHDNRFFAVGSEEEVRAQVPGGTPELDLGGRTATPGLIDAHNHFLQTAESLTWLDARYPDVSSVADLLRLVAGAAAGKSPGQWIYAFGLNYAKLSDGRMPTRWDLDQVSGDHPVLVHHISGHHALVNTLALQTRAGQNPVDPKGGSFLRDARGQVNGWCLDAAMGIVVPIAVDIGDHGPNIHFEVEMSKLVDALEEGSREYLSVGLTTVCDAQVTRRELAAYREGYRQGKLGIRVVCMPLSHQLDALLATGVAGPLGDDWLSLGPMKFYSDGALSGGTACFREPYGESGEFAGIHYHTPEELKSLVGRAQADGWQVGIHAQGDQAITMSLDAIEAGLRGSDGRHRLEHAGYPIEELDRIERLGVVTVNQPGYLYDFGDTFLSQLGSRAHHLLPLRTQVDRGISVVLSSDSFVTTYRPLHHIAAAVNRKTQSGQLIGADQALTVEEAVRGYTIEAARSMFAEDRVGSVEVGKLADLVVFEEDPFSVPNETLADVGIAMTVLGGNVVYDSARG